MSSSRLNKLVTNSLKEPSNNAFIVTVGLLENGNSITIGVPDDAKGRWLLEEVCKQQQVLPEIEYFGLRFVSCDILSEPSKHWMQAAKTVKSQLKHTNPLVVSFRIKHYPPDPFSDFKLDKSKYLLFHQLHRDFLSGRLIAPHDDLIRLAALFIQVALGDASEMQSLESNEQGGSGSNASGGSAGAYLLNYRTLHSASSKKYEAEILKQHSKLDGLLPSEAASEAIRIAMRQLSYGLEPFRVTPSKRKSLRTVHIGLTHEGVAEFAGSKRTNLYKWADIEQFFYTGKEFIISYRKKTKKGRKQALEPIEYKCESRAIAKELWHWALERKLFFTLEKSTVVKPISTKYNLFARRHTFNYTGRSRSELINSKPSTATLPRPDSSRAYASMHSSLEAPTSGIPLVSSFVPSSASSTHHRSRNSHPSQSPPNFPHQRHNHPDKRHHIYRQNTSTASRSSTLSSVASRLVSSKSQEFSDTPPASSSGAVATDEAHSYGGDYNSLAENSDAASTDSALEPPASVKLAPYFESIPNRKYSTISRLRQQRFVNLATDPSTRSLRSLEDLRLNGILSEPICEVCEPPIEVLEKSPEFSAAKTGQGEGFADRESSIEEKAVERRMVSPLWRCALFTGGLSFLLIALGTSLASDMGIKSALLRGIRSTPPFVQWESFFYQPLRSLLTGFFAK